MRLDFDALLQPLLAAAEILDDLVDLHHLADLVLARAGVGDDHVVDDPAVLHLAVGRLDEAELVDPRVGRQGRDQADVRTFRRLNRADAAVVRRVHVAHLEPGAFARQAAGPEGRQAPLVRDLRQRVGLVHELRQLRRPEELANRGHDRLRVDQVVRHGRRHFLVDGHLLLDGPLHAHQADAELVLEQLADRPDAAVAQVVDVVHVRRVLAQLQQVPDHLVEVLRVQDLLFEGRRDAELRVQLQAADPREVVLLRVEEHVLEERARAVQRRRVARTQAAVDLDERLFVGADRHPCAAWSRWSRPTSSRSGKNTSRRSTCFSWAMAMMRCVTSSLASRMISPVSGSTMSAAANAPSRSASSILTACDAGVAQRLDGRRGDLAALVDDRLGAGNADVLAGAEPDQAVGHAPVERAGVLLEVDAIDRVERPDDLVGRAQAEGAQEHRREELALAVDAHVEQVLGVVLELDPRPAVRDDLGDVEVLVFRVEERARRPVQLRDDDALGAVDDERAVLGHQRDVAEVDLLLLDVADGLGARSPGPCSTRRGGWSPSGARRRSCRVPGTRPRRTCASGRPSCRRRRTRRRWLRSTVPHCGHSTSRSPYGIDDELVAAAGARLAEVLEALEPAALAFPVPDGILDELERGVLPEVADREDGLEHRLEADVFPLVREPVHLEEPFVRPLLDLDQVRNRNRGLDLREVDALAIDVLRKAVHAALGTRA